MPTSADVDIKIQIELKPIQYGNQLCTGVLLDESTLIYETQKMAELDFPSLRVTSLALITLISHTR